MTWLDDPAWNDQAWLDNSGFFEDFPPLPDSNSVITIDVAIHGEGLEDSLAELGLTREQLPEEGGTLHIPQAFCRSEAKASLWSRLKLRLWNCLSRITSAPSEPTEAAMPEQTSCSTAPAGPATVNCTFAIDLDQLRSLHATACDTRQPEKSRREALSGLLASYPCVVTALSMTAIRSQEMEQQLTELQHSRYEQASKRSSN